MKIIFGAFAFVAGFFFTPLVVAADSSEISFSQGSVLIVCAPPEGVDVTTEQFNSAFPDWITFLQIKANEGVIIRAHYLGELKSGIFIVVAGDDKDGAMKNALLVIDELDDISQKAGLEGSNTCNFREIGPVAILPQ